MAAEANWAVYDREEKEMFVFETEAEALMKAADLLREVREASKIKGVWDGWEESWAEAICVMQVRHRAQKVDPNVPYMLVEYRMQSVPQLPWEPAELPETTTPRIVARCTLQVIIDGNAHDTDTVVPFDVTKAILAMSREDALNISDDSYDSDHLWMESAEAAVCPHQGPFRVTVMDAIEEWFETQEKGQHGKEETGRETPNDPSMDGSVAPAQDAGDCPGGSA